MSSPDRIIKGIKQFGTVNKLPNPIGELLWTSKQAVLADRNLADQVLGKGEGVSRLGGILQRAQRMLEIGYIFTEVFVREEYKNWQPQSESPVVIDLGGDAAAISPLYWKMRAPKAQITVVEANPATAEAMANTLKRRKTETTTVINAAVAADTQGQAILNMHTPTRGFHPSDYVGSHGKLSADSYSVSVPKIKLSDIVGGKKVDLLKVDIEGSENAAMRELARSGKLGQVRQIIMEFHHDPVTHPDNSLTEVLNILTSAGFTIGEAHTSGKGRRGKLVPIDIGNIAQSSQRIVFTFSATQQ